MEDVLRRTPESFWKCGSYWRSTNLSQDIIGDSFAIPEFGNIKSSPLKIRSIRVIIKCIKFFEIDPSPPPSPLEGERGRVRGGRGYRCFQKRWEEENS